MPLGGDLLWEKKANSPSCRGTFLPHFQLALQGIDRGEHEPSLAAAVLYRRSLYEGATIDEG